MSQASPIPKLVLASASPRRAALLQQIGVAFECRPQAIDESPREAEAAVEYALRMAVEKAQSALGDAAPTTAVLASDTVVVVGDEILGKPGNRQQALSTLAKLSDKRHRVLTAVVVASKNRLAHRLSASEVEFRAITAIEAEQYWRSGEPQDKAGAYAIQGLAAVFVRSLQGSFSGVMGLPLYETAELLREFAVPCWQGLDESADE